MKKAVIIFLGIALHANLMAQLLTNNLTGNIASFGIAERTNLTMMLKIITPKNRTINNIFISNDPIPAYSDANGNFAFTNIQWGQYSLQAQDSIGSTWICYVGTNTTGTWPIANLVTNSAAIPPNPATNYLTAAQTYALLTSGNSATNILWGTSQSPDNNSRLANLYFKFPQPTNTITFILNTN